MFTLPEYCTWAIVGLLWVIQLLFLFFLYGPLARRDRGVAADKLSTDAVVNETDKPVTEEVSPTSEEVTPTSEEVPSVKEELVPANETISSVNETSSTVSEAISAVSEAISAVTAEASGMVSSKEESTNNVVNETTTVAPEMPATAPIISAAAPKSPSTSRKKKAAKSDPYQIDLFSDDAFAGPLFANSTPAPKNENKAESVKPSVAETRIQVEVEPAPVVEKAPIPEPEPKHTPEPVTATATEPVTATAPTTATTPVTSTTPATKAVTSQVSESDPKSTLPGISLIVVTSNQVDFLRDNLPSLLEQDYPNYEVIVVDDCSSDETTDYLVYLQGQYPRLRTTFTPAGSRRVSRRKLSLTLGIKAATREWVAFTDPDCHPDSNHWLSALAAQLPVADNATSNDVDAVIAYTGSTEAEGFGARLRCYDNLLRQSRILALALRGKAHMAFGTNLVWRRSIFFDNKGFSAHLDLERGEDDLFVNDNIPSSHIRAAITSDAIVRRPVKERYQWRVERLGRIVTSRRLHGFRPYLLGIDTFTRVLYALVTLATLVLCIISKLWITLGIVAFLWALRYLGHWLVWRRIQRRFGEPDFAILLPLLDLAQPVWELALRIRLLLTPRGIWRRKTI